METKTRRMAIIALIVVLSAGIIGWFFLKKIQNINQQPIKQAAVIDEVSDLKENDFENKKAELEDARVEDEIDGNLYRNNTYGFEFQFPMDLLESNDEYLGFFGGGGLSGEPPIYEGERPIFYKKLVTEPVKIINPKNNTKVDIVSGIGVKVWDKKWKKSQAVDVPHDVFLFEEKDRVKSSNIKDGYFSIGPHHGMGATWKHREIYIPKEDYVIMLSVFYDSPDLNNDDNVPGPSPDSNEKVNNITKKVLSTFKFVEFASDETEGWQTYRNDKYGFELKYPSIFTEKFGIKDRNLEVLLSLTNADYGEVGVFVKDEEMNIREIKDVYEKRDDEMTDFISVGETEIIVSKKMAGDGDCMADVAYVPVKSKTLGLSFIGCKREGFPEEYRNKILSTFKFTN